MTPNSVMLDCCLSVGKETGLNWPRIASRSGVTSQPVLVPWKRKLGPWFFLIVTNNLKAREADM